MSPARKTTRRKKKPASPPPKGETPVTLASGDRSQRLGTKHLCFSCGAKFYDLNKPEPLCPRCGANQLEKPKDAPPPPSPPAEPARKLVKDMAPLLEDEEADTSDDDGDVDLDDDLFEGAEEESSDDED